MKIVICEDNRADREKLYLFADRYFKELNCPAEIETYQNGASFLVDLTAKRIKDVKLAFLDIYMPGITGVETARKIREIDSDMAIVFVTTSRDHGLDGYAVEAFRYLVKPVDYPEIVKTLNKCVDIFADSIRFVEVVSDRLKVKVRLKDIMYIEVFNTVLLIHTTTETLKCYHITLSELEKQLEDSSFLRTYRSYIVNMKYIADVLKDDFLLSNGKKIPISKGGKIAVKQAYTDYLFSLTGGL